MVWKKVNNSHLKCVILFEGYSQGTWKLFHCKDKSITDRLVYFYLWKNQGKLKKYWLKRTHWKFPLATLCFFLCTGMDSKPHIDRNKCLWPSSEIDTWLNQHHCSHYGTHVNMLNIFIFFQYFILYIFTSRGEVRAFLCKFVVNFGQKQTVWEEPFLIS